MAHLWFTDIVSRLWKSADTLTLFIIYLIVVYSFNNVL